METIRTLLEFILHLDEHLISFVTTYGVWTYALLFLIIFSETALIFLAFLPGDSLLFATGALSANTDGALNIHVIFILLLVASVVGNGVNYFLGYWIGPKVFRTDSFWFNRKHIDQAHYFYERYGGKTIIIARFIPIVRTFAPFIAGIGYMTYRQFFIYNLIGALLWIGGLLYISYWFGNISFVKEHFSLVVLGIIIVSLLPPIFEIVRRKWAKCL
jgi:membrane-associated protein